jgi:hypothetical protein
VRLLVSVPPELDPAPLPTFGVLARDAQCNARCCERHFGLVQPSGKDRGAGAKQATARCCAEGGCTSPSSDDNKRAKTHQNHPANAASQAAARKCEICISIRV